MTRVSRVLSFGLVLAAAGHGPAAAARQPRAPRDALPTHVYVLAKYAPLRALNDSTSPIYTWVTHGDRLEVAGRYGDWWSVVAPGTRFGVYVSENDVSETALESTPETPLPDGAGALAADAAPQPLTSLPVTLPARSVRFLRPSALPAADAAPPLLLTSPPVTLPAGSVRLLRPGLLSSRSPEVPSRADLALHLFQPDLPAPELSRFVWRNPPRLEPTDVGWGWKVIPGLVGLAVGLVTDNALSEGREECNPLLAWAEEKPGSVTAVKLATGIAAGAVVHRIATHHRRPRAAKLFAAAVTAWNAADLAIDLHATR
jgi:hypothetical protein